MKHRNNFTSLLFILITIFFVPVQIKTMGQQFGGMPQMTPEQLQDLERELAEANKMVNDYVSTLSPEEQAEFNRAVDEVSQMFENMDEEEFNKFMEELFTEEPSAEEPAQAPPQPVAPPVQEEEEEIIAPEKGKIENALAMLDDIIKQTNAFIVKVQSSPELPARIERWGKEKSISNWQPDLTWSSFKAQTELLIQKLQKAKDKNPKTKAYKYLADLIEDEALYNNLSQLQTNLIKTVHLVEIPVFAAEKISKKSKKAVRSVMNHLIEGMYILKIPQALEKLFEKFEPKAKKVREAEEFAEKQAIEASKRQRVPARAVEAGVAFEGGYGVDHGYSPSYGGYESSRPSIDYSTPSYTARAPSYSPTRAEEKGEDKKMPSQPTTLAPSTKAKDEEKEKIEDLARTAKSTEVPTDQATDALLLEIKLSMKDVARKITSNKILQSIDAHLTGGGEVNESLSNDVLPEINEKINSIRDTIKTMEKKVSQFADRVREYYSKELNTAIDQSKESLVNLSLAIKKVDITKVSLEKQYVYLGDDKALEEMKKNKDLKTKAEDLEKKDKPLSLKEVQKSIDDLLEEVKTFAEKKEVPTKKPAIK